MLPLPLVHAHELSDQARQVLRPGETLQDRCGISRTLPSSFLRVDSWSQALETPLTMHGAPPLFAEAHHIGLVNHACSYSSRIGGKPSPVKVS